MVHKFDATGIEIMQFASALAVIPYNEGCTGVERLLNKLDIEIVQRLKNTYLQKFLNWIKIFRYCFISVARVLRTSSQQNRSGFICMLHVVKQPCKRTAIFNNNIPI